MRTRAGKESASIFSIKWARWISTVRGLIPRVSAILLFGNPLTSRRMTSRSRGVQESTRACTNCSSESCSRAKR